MSVAKYLPFALLAGGVLVLWRVSKGVQAALPAAPAPVNGLGRGPGGMWAGAGMGEYRPNSMWAGSMASEMGMGDLGFGFKSVARAVSQTVMTPAKAAVVPLRLAAAVPLAVGAGVKGGSWSAGVDSLRKSAISPVTSLTKGTTAFQIPILSKALSKGMSAPGARVMFGRAKPVTRSGVPATTAAAAVTDVQWTPVAGRSGWSTAPGEGGTTVFKGPAGQMFSATPGDISSLGGPTGVIDYYLGLGPNGDVTDAPQQSAETSGSAVSMPPVQAGGGGGQSYTSPGIMDPSMIPQQSTWGGSAPATDASQPQVDPAAVAQQQQQTDVPTVDPASPDNKTLSPLAVGAAAVGAAALLFLGGGKH